MGGDVRRSTLYLSLANRKVDDSCWTVGCERGTWNPSNSHIWLLVDSSACCCHTPGTPLASGAKLCEGPVLLVLWGRLPHSAQKTGVADEADDPSCWDNG